MGTTVIDADKVNAWTASMRGAFGGGPPATWLVAAVVAVALIAGLWLVLSTRIHAAKPLR